MHEMKFINKRILFFSILVIIVSIVLPACTSNIGITPVIVNNSQAQTPSEQIENVQIVLVGVDGGTYVFTPNTINVGQTTILRSDGSVRGCASYLVQQELGITANFAKNTEYTFTPTKVGEFRVSCSMNMYSGVLRVE